MRYPLSGLRKYSFLLFLLSYGNASADVCPEEGEAIITTPYQFSKICPATTIVVKGERNPDKYSSCLGDTPYEHEQVYYVDNHKNETPLPTVNSFLSSNDFFKLRLYVVGDLDDQNIKCVGDKRVSIEFWSGGNCDECLRRVNYDFGADGQLQKALLESLMQ